MPSRDPTRRDEAATSQISPAAATVPLSSLLRKSHDDMAVSSLLLRRTNHMSINFGGIFLSMSERSSCRTTAARYMCC